MTSWQRFIALWTHRYKKYSHIGRKFILAYRDFLRFFFIRHLQGKEVVAIILSEQFGDIVACEPVSRRVRALHPKAHIIWMVRKPYKELVEHNPHLDGYLLEYCVSHRIQLLRLGAFDKVYNLHLSHRNCHYCGGDHVNPIADRLDITYHNYLHHGDLLYTFSQAAGLPAMDEEPKVYIPESARQKIAALNLESPIVLHCKPSYPERDWIQDNWDKLVKWLLETYPYPIVEVGLESVVRVKDPRIVNLCGQLSILETAEVIRISKLFIGVESGPAHLANAVGAEAVILLGKTGVFDEFNVYSGRFKRGEDVAILSQPGLYCATIPLDWVRQATEEKLNQPVSK
ncbi:glycosyltransferase family 9 protein [Tellurirhabdus rosea]|uniref:glycosyltransferase family 9 protein n=1 Tax=Tellurirhabdus rosea TaxID=2674997 RepID=UPI00225A2224|nr:glycosyltransferase family 9 protein [Tellurirhabdus rosea]